MQTVPKADKIFGPGNQWVTAAKMLVQNEIDAFVTIDMPGPLDHPGRSCGLVSPPWRRDRPLLGKSES